MLTNLATVYWGVILTFNLLLILFITHWIHINTMTKRHTELLQRVNELHKRMDETNQLIDDLIDELPQQPAQPQGYMPVYPVQSPLPQHPQIQMPYPQQERP